MIFAEATTELLVSPRALEKNCHGSKAANVILAMAIAAFKASLVMLFFMHLKYETKTMIVIAMIPYVLAAVLLFALFPDIVFGQYN